MADDSFSACLNSYCAELGCTNKELAELSGVSASTLSRYRSAERMPDPEGESLSKISSGIARMAESRGNELLSDVEKVHTTLAQTIRRSRPDADAYRARLNDLMDLLGISNAEMARHVHVDPSFLSRIRSGQRFPAEPEKYARSFALLAARRAFEPGMGEKLESLFAREKWPNSLSEYLAAGEQDEVARTVEEWLLQGGTQSSTHVEHFLEFLDDFDLNEYIRTIHYDDIKVPTMPVVVPVSKDYYGLAGMREAELEFLKVTATSRKAKEAIMFSDMAMADLAADSDFAKRYAMGVGAMLKRGVSLSVIHDVSRPFGEMMIGLEGWIPLYMTGQVHPYYLKGSRDRVFGHLCNCSDVAGLQGECIHGYHEEGRYQFTTKRDEVMYVQRRAHVLLSRAVPLMQIYRQSDAVGFARFEREERARMQGGAGVRVGESTFKNMTIVSYGSVVVVEKLNEPRIAFVIRHPRLCEAITNLGVM